MAGFAGMDPTRYQSLEATRPVRLAFRRLVVLFLATFGALALDEVNAQPTPVPSVTLLRGDGNPLREDIVILGDGYTAVEQATFDSQVDELVSRLLGSPPTTPGMPPATPGKKPLDEFQNVFNVYRVNVHSIESSTDEFVANCVSNDLDKEGRLFPIPDDVNTALNTGFCGAGLPNTVHHLMLARDELRVHDLAASAADYDVVLVLVNTPQFGGGSPRVATSTNGHRFAFSTTVSGADPNMVNIMFHEMGHAMADLADEYADDSAPSWSGGEPSPPNVTAATDPNELKWRDLIMPPDANIPTSETSTHCQTAILPTLRNVVGTFAGAYYRSCGVYRSQADCIMKDRKSALCAVCLRQFVAVLKERREQIDSTPGLGLTPVATGTVAVAAPRSIRLVLAQRQNQIEVLRARGSYGLPRPLSENRRAWLMDEFLSGASELIAYRGLGAADEALYSGQFALMKNAVVEESYPGNQGMKRWLVPLPIPIVHVDIPYSVGLTSVEFTRLVPTGATDVSQWRAIPMGRKSVSVP